MTHAIVLKTKIHTVLQIDYRILITLIITSKSIERTIYSFWWKRNTLTLHVETQRVPTCNLLFMRLVYVSRLIINIIYTISSIVSLHIGI